MNPIANRALVFGAALLLLCACSPKKNAPLEAEVKEYDLGQRTTTNGSPLVAVLNSPTNLFYGRLVEKVIGKRRLLLDGTPLRDVGRVFLVFEQGDGQRFVTGDSDASQAVFEWGDRLEVGKMYRLPEDLEIDLQDKQSATLDLDQRVGRLEGFGADGISLADVLSSPTNLFQGRLNQKRFGVLKFQLDKLPPRDAWHMALYFKGEAGQDFLISTGDANQDELKLGQRLELGKVYRLPEDLKSSGR